MKHLIELWIGPIAFLAASWLLQPTFSRPAAIALATVLWMALWWVFRPISIYVTAFIPIAVNAVCALIPNDHVISQYFSEIAVLLLGSDLICLTWTSTGLDKRISVKALCFIGTSMKSQVFCWFIASVVLSIFLPNVVVAAIFCPVAVAMLHFVGEKDIAISKTTVPILLAISWGSGIGGFGSPIGSSANLVAVSYLEKFTGHEFMYYDWVIRFLPLLAIVCIVNLIFLFLIPSGRKNLAGTKEYFRKMYKSFGPMRKGERIGLVFFVAATLLAFIRPLYAAYVPALKPAYVFLLCGLLLFFLEDENDMPMLTWKQAESHVMWGMIFLFASGLALGRLVMETGAIDRLAELALTLPIHPGWETLALCCAFACGMSEISSNTASASISLPVIFGITGAMGINPIPYVLISIVAFNCAYILPISTRAIPVGYGLDASKQIRYGVVLSLLTLATTIIVGTFCMNHFPLFNIL